MAAPHTMRSTATAPAATMLGKSLLDLVGNTPLLRLDGLLAERLSRLRIGMPAGGVQLLGKAEWANPGGSVKDRAASFIVRDAVTRGLLLPDSRTVPGSRALLDATSGNTGIAYAMLGAAQGFRVTLCMPTNVSPERKRILQAYGAEIVWTEPGEGSDSAIRMARRLAAERPDEFYYANQYGNENNWRAHYLTTAEEIWRQTEGRVTHFVAGLGTSGTFVGTTRRLRELKPSVRCYSMQPDSPFNGLEGLKHMETAIVPPIYDPTLADRDIAMPTERAYAMAKHLGQTEGLLIGISAAAAVSAALDTAVEEARAGREAVIVTILCDSADKYLSERFWTEPTPETAAEDAVDSNVWEGQLA